MDAHLTAGPWWDITRYLRAGVYCSNAVPANVVRDDYYSVGSCTDK